MDYSSAHMFTSLHVVLVKRQNAFVLFISSHNITAPIHLPNVSESKQDLCQSVSLTAEKQVRELPAIILTKNV